MSVCSQSAAECGARSPRHRDGRPPLHRVYLPSSPFHLRPAGGGRGDPQPLPPAAATTHRGASPVTAAASPAGGRSALSGYSGGRGLARDVTAGGNAAGTQGRGRGLRGGGRGLRGGSTWGGNGGFPAGRCRGRGPGLWVPSPPGKRGRPSAPRPGTAWGVRQLFAPVPPSAPGGSPAAVLSHLETAASLSPGAPGRGRSRHRHSSPGALNIRP